MTDKEAFYAYQKGTDEIKTLTRQLGQLGEREEIDTGFKSYLENRIREIREEISPLYADAKGYAKFLGVKI